MREKFVIIDNGHGIDTAGKCSPDGRLREWEWTRRAARRLAASLAERGIRSSLLVPEECDISLDVRVARANALARAHDGAVLISLHTNAATATPRWSTASGWTAWVCPTASWDARRLAAFLADAAIVRGLTGNRYIPPCGYRTAPFAICRRTICPAVLTENMFHDNRDDVELLLSDEGLEKLVNLHVDALVNYYEI